MTRSKNDAPLSGKTLRWTFEEGSMAGTTFEHHFYANGTVSYRTVDTSSDADDSGKAKKKGESERPKYKAFEMGTDIVLASYLAESGFTLTVALNFGDGRIAGFASNDKQWFPCLGTFEEVPA